MCFIKKKILGWQKEKEYLPCRPITPEHFLPAQLLSTDSCLPAGQQGESECRLGCEWVGSPSGLRGLHRVAQFGQDEELMQLSWGLLTSLSVPSAHPHGSLYPGWSAISGCGRDRTLCNDWANLEPSFLRASGCCQQSEAHVKQGIGHKSPAALLHMAFSALALLQVTGQAKLSAPDLPFLPLTPWGQSHQNLLGFSFMRTLL